jgi:hypothetical protein
MPGIGPIGGKLDYLTSRFAGNKRPDIPTSLSAQLRMETPYLLVCEAKTGETIVNSASLYQLIAQTICGGGT